jgi:hypothetical protein
MTLADLAGRLARTADSKVRWKLVWEFFEEYRWEPAAEQPGLLADEPRPIGDERWDALLAAIAEHLAAQHDLAPPAWTELRVLERPWFPAELTAQRADALVTAPAAFRKHGVYLSAADLGSALLPPPLAQLPRHVGVKAQVKLRLGSLVHRPLRRPLNAARRVGVHLLECLGGAGKYLVVGQPVEQAVAHDSLRSKRASR